MSEDLKGTIAVVGMVGRFPGADSVDVFWQNVRGGVDSVRFFTDEELAALGVPAAELADPGYVKASAQPDHIDRFDAPFFGINHREAEVLDPQQRLFLEAAWEALESAGYDPEASGQVVGVFAGATLSTYLLFNLLPNAGLVEALDPLQLLVGNTGDSVATRVSYKLNLKGPSFTVQSACSTSLVAVHTACQSLLNGECDLALAGGVSLNMSLLHGYKRKEGSVFSPEGRCRAFDAGAQGILFGGGLGIVVLKRVEDAEASGDTIHAVIRGSAVNNDGGLKVGYTAPSVEGQAEVIAEALAVAGVPAESIGYVEAHGTGTRLGDPIEIQALTKAFRAETERRGFCALGSVKTNIGHLDVAAGVAGLIKTVLALRHRELPPSLHFAAANPEIDFAASPVYVNTELRPWTADGVPRRAGVSSFGFGGTNAHLVLEEAPAPPARPIVDGWQALPLSARSEAALARAAAALAAHLRAHAELPLADVAYTLQVGRKGFEERRLVLCRDRAEAIRSLAGGDPARAWTSSSGSGAHPAMPWEGTAEGDRWASLGTLAVAWLAGETVDWASLHPRGERRRVPLPTYPFERESYWIAAPGAPRLPWMEGAPAAAGTEPGPQESGPLVALAGSPTQTLHPRPTLFNPSVPPRDEPERKVAAIWQEILGVEPVGAHDNFFQLGGHSLLATQVLSRVRQVFGVEFPLQHVFSFPTAAELAEAIGFLQAEAQAEGAVDRIEPSPLRAHGGPYPLSFAQERFWFLQQLEPGNPAFNIPAAVRLSGRLGIAALAAALAEVVRRHESLRTRFVDGDESVAQVVEPFVDLPLPLADLSALPPAARDGEERRLVLAHAVLSFDLRRAPLVAALLLRVAADEHRLAVVVHHIVSDGWSIGVLERELVQHYRRFLDGGLAPPELPLQYVDFAHWQRERLAGERLAGLLAYWRTRLAALPALELRGDRPRPPVQTFRGEYEDVRLTAPLTRQLGELAQREGASLFMVLLGGFAALLSRYSGQSDFAVGAFIANRTRVELEALIGFFVNNLALRIDLSGGPSGRVALARLRETTVGAYEHQELPFEKLVAELQPERDMSRAAVVQATLNFLNFPAVHAELPGLTLEGAGVRNDRANYDLTLWLSESADGLVGWLEYNADLFERATARRMVGHLARLLEGLAASAEGRIGELPLLSAGEEAELRTWGERRDELPAAGFLPHLLADQVARTPEAVALRDDAESLTYRELDARACRLAGWLLRQGIEPEARIGLALGRTAEMVIAVVAVLKAGAAYLPLDPAHPRERLAMIVEDARPSLILTEEALAADLPGEDALKVALDRPELRAEIAAESPESPAVARDPLALAYVLFTSGSTGRPKGVQVPHRALVNFLVSMAREPGLWAGDAVLAITTLSFDIAGLELLLPLLVGGRIELASRDDAGDGARLAARLARSGAKVLQATPATWRMLLDAGWDGDLGLKALCGGEALPSELAARLLPRVGELWNVYGPTETTVWSAAGRVTSIAPEAGSIAIGGPVANTDLLLLDERLQRVPVGVAGEVAIGGLGLARGYLGRPELTAERFIPHPAGDGTRIYRTGDLALRRPGGAIEFLGRIDHQVKVRGFRIELGEIEAALLQHPALQTAAVVVWGGADGDRRLVAYAVPNAGIAVNAADLDAFLRPRLPEYMLPSVVGFVDALPLSPTGKVDRKALARRPLPGRERAAGRAARPSTATEERLAEIWRQVLDLPQVSPDDSFFSLGGHSLLGARLMARVRDRFAVELPLRTLFEASTLAALA
ncbi:MAG TPA: amino acid adenylation domain-containing protein, partial [Thermoanaerobaculia bacterium]